MAFNYFLVVVAVLYLLYYLILIALDLFNMGKDKGDNDNGVEVDITDAIAGYVPKDASEIIDNESKVVMREMEERERASYENQTIFETEREEGGKGNDLPYEVDAYAPIDAEETEENNGAGSMNIQYELSGEEREQGEESYPEIEINGGYTPGHMKDLFAEMAKSDNLFKDVKFI